MGPTRRSVRDDLDFGMELPARVSRIVSLVPSLTEAVAAAAPEVLVGATQWCTHPPDLAVERVRGTKNPDVRRIAAIGPDLVLANREENRRLDVDRLRAQGVPVWVTDIRSVDRAFESLERLFRIALDVAVPAWLDAARTAWAIPAAPALRAAVLIWRDPWMAVGGDTFADDLARRIGLVNLFAGAGSRYPTVTIGEVLAAAPDVLLLPDEPYPFHAGDGPEAFPTVPSALVSGRLLTWYGPSLVEARPVLTEAVASVVAAGGGRVDL